MTDRGPPFGVAVAALALLAVVAHAPAVSAPFSFDDRYVLAHLVSARWSDRIAAFDVDLPGADLGAWWDGVRVQRRFVRIAPSVAMAAELRALGPDPVRLHLVTLALHVVNVVLAYGLLGRWLPGRSRWGAFGGAAVFAAHPAATEAIGWWCCQPIVLAGGFALAAAIGVTRWRDRGSRAALGLAWLACAASVTSYEAAAALPLLLVALDRALDRRNQVRERVAVAGGFFAAWPILAALTAHGRRGLAAPDTAFRPSAAEIWCTGRTDLANYVLKSVALVDPRQPGAYWLYNAVGELAALVVVGCVVAPVAVWAARDRAARWLILAAAALLAPPYLVRTFVGVMNFPTLRQLYLPMLALSALVGLALARSPRRWARFVPVGFAVAVTPFAWVGGPSRFDPRAAHAGEQVRAALADTADGVPVVVIGAFRGGPAGCSYGLAFDWPERRQWMLVPPARGGSVELAREDDHTFVATAADGFDVPVVRRPHRRVRCEPGAYSPFGTRADALPPPLADQGWQDVGGARVEVVDRTDAAIRGLRFRLDAPLDGYAFLHASGCAEIERRWISQRYSSD
jgi:hypothetical protein